MSSDAPLWLGEREVAELLSLPEAIDVLERTLRLEAAGEARAMEKTHVAFGHGHGLHALGASFDRAGFVGTKTWAHTAGGATPLLVLWHSNSGALAAIVEAFALGQLRTAAIVGVATRWLAREDAGELAMVGSGRQALPQVAAVAAVRRLRRVRIWSPDAEHRASFAKRLEREGFEFEVRQAASIDEALEGASVVTLATRAREPFLAARHVAAGAHVNAIGAITPERAELCADLFERCDLLAVDSLPAARELSRELRERADAGKLDWSTLLRICDVVARGAARPEHCDVSIFKSMGTGVADVALGLEVLERARRSRAGRPIPQPERASARLRQSGDR